MASPVPYTDTPANVPVGDPAEAARRFRRFVLLDLAAAGARIVVIAVVLVVVRTPLAWPLLVATVLCVGLLTWALPLYRSGRVDTAVLAVCATFWLQLIVAPPVVPPLFGGFAVLTVFSVLFAIPSSSAAPSSSSRSPLRSPPSWPSCLPSARSYPWFQACRRRSSRACSSSSRWRSSDSASPSCMRTRGRLLEVPTGCGTPTRS
jgi:hypothetical protein